MKELTAEQIKEELRLLIKVYKVQIKERGKYDLFVENIIERLNQLVEKKKLSCIDCELNGLYDSCPGFNYCPYMKEKRMYIVSVEYSGCENLQENDEKIEKLIGKEKNSSGYYFADKRRDVGFEYKTLKEAKKVGDNFKKNMKKLNIPELSVHVFKI